jgi:hypothetical protein
MEFPPEMIFIYQSTQPHIPRDDNIYIYHCQNLKYSDSFSVCYRYLGTHYYLRQEFNIKWMKQKKWKKLICVSNKLTTRIWINAQLNSTITLVSEKTWLECRPCLFQAMTISGMRQKYVREKISEFITRDAVQSHGDLCMAVNVYQRNSVLLQC